MPTHVRAADAPEDLWRCHECGWTYPNHHPSAKHRRNHKRQCGKLPGFPVSKTSSSGPPFSHLPHVTAESSDDTSDDEQHRSPHQVQERNLHHQGCTAAPSPPAGVTVVEQISVAESTGILSDHNSLPRKCARSTSFDDKPDDGDQVGIAPNPSGEAASLTRTLDLLQVKQKSDTLNGSHQGRRHQGSVQGARSFRSAHAVEDQWSCRHCGWTYPNAHPSAKYRRKHKKKCGAPSAQGGTGGSSEDASSDEDHHHQNAGLETDLSAANKSGSINSAAPKENKLSHPELLLLTVEPPVGGVGDAACRASDQEIKIKQNLLEKSDSGELERALTNREGELSEQTAPGSFDVAAQRSEILVSSQVSTIAAKTAAKLNELHFHALALLEPPACEPGLGQNVGSLDSLAKKAELFALFLQIPPTAEPQIGSVYASIGGKEFLDFSSGERPITAAPPFEVSGDVGDPAGVVEEELTEHECRESPLVTAEEHITPCGGHLKVEQESNSGASAHFQDPENLWTCLDCGGTYPNAHPSAKHRRNHRCETVGAKVQGGSADDAPTDDELLHHHRHQESVIEEECATWTTERGQKGHVAGLRELSYSENSGNPAIVDQLVVEAINLRTAELFVTAENVAVTAASSDPLEFTRKHEKEIPLTVSVVHVAARGKDLSESLETSDSQDAGVGKRIDEIVDIHESMERSDAECQVGTEGRSRVADISGTQKLPEFKGSERSSYEHAENQIRSSGERLVDKESASQPGVVGEERTDAGTEEEKQKALDKSGSEPNKVLTEKSEPEKCNVSVSQVAVCRARVVGVDVPQGKRAGDCPQWQLRSMKSLIREINPQRVPLRLDSSDPQALLIAEFMNEPTGIQEEGKINSRAFQLAAVGRERASFVTEEKMQQKLESTGTLIAVKDINQNAAIQDPDAETTSSSVSQIVAVGEEVASGKGDRAHDTLDSTNLIEPQAPTEWQLTSMKTLLLDSVVSEEVVLGEGTASKLTLEKVPSTHHSSDIHAPLAEKVGSSQSPALAEIPRKMTSEESKSRVAVVTIVDQQKLNVTPKQQLSRRRDSSEPLVPLSQVNVDKHNNKLEKDGGSFQTVSQVNNSYFGDWIRRSPFNSPQSEPAEQAEAEVLRSPPGSPEGMVRARVEEFEKLAGIDLQHRRKSLSPAVSSSPPTSGAHHSRNNGSAERTSIDFHEIPKDLHETISHLRHQQSNGRRSIAASEHDAPSELFEVMSHLRRRGKIFLGEGHEGPLGYVDDTEEESIMLVDKTQGSSPAECCPCVPWLGKSQ